MKNKIIKIINILLIVSFMFTPLTSYAEPVETEESGSGEPKPEAEKGALKCPDEENGKSCIETKVNGVVTKTETVVEDNNIKITKVVETTDEIGKYKVYFKYYSKSIILRKKPDVNIVLVLDASSSVTYHYNDGVGLKGNTNKHCHPEIPNAARSFANEFAENSNVYLGVIKFNSKATILREFKKGNFNDVEFGRVKVNSYINLAMDKVEELFNKSNSNSYKRKNYVIILGDGKYGKGELNSAIRSANRLRTNKNATIYTIAFGAGVSGTYKKNLIKIAGEESRYYPNKEWNNITNAFLHFANIITQEINNVSTNSNAYLYDKLGNSFTISDNSLAQHEKEIIIDNITTTESATAPFYITINQASEKGWHPTNDGFTMSYIDKDNNPIKIGSSVNSEVYWIQPKTDIDSCSGEIEQDAPIVKTIKNSYYSIHCEEGYTENGKKYPNFTTAMKVNNLDDGVKEFNLPSGAGFTAEVSLKTNIKCTYNFKAGEYNKDYNNLEQEISKLDREIESLKTSPNSQILETGDTATYKYGDNRIANIKLGEVSATSSIKPIEVALYGKKVGDVFEVTIHDSFKDTDETYTVTVISITKRDLVNEKRQKISKLNSLKAIADEYLTLSSEMALETYKNKFFSLKPALNVTYKTISGEIFKYDREFETEIVDKEPKNGKKFNNSDEHPVCQSKEEYTIKIGNKTEKVLNQTCTGNFWRIMNIEKICLNMKTGKTEKCSDTETTKQLDGLNKRYTPLILDEDTKKMVKLNGDIVITLEKAGYDESVNVTLKDCKVKGQTSDAYYREIDVADPFLQNATHGQRTIGSNFKGEYDFVKIISPTIWNSNNPLYTFNLSKVDVATIENDTTNLGKISYLGDDCYISNHKYACTLPHQYKK